MLAFKILMNGVFYFINFFLLKLILKYFQFPNNLLFENGKTKRARNRKRFLISKSYKIGIFNKCLFTAKCN